VDNQLKNHLNLLCDRINVTRPAQGVQPPNVPQEENKEEASGKKEENELRHRFVTFL
jgi:hypothetical protein